MSTQMMPAMTEDSQLNSKAAAEEGFEQKMAFEMYYKLGAERSIGKVSEELARPKKTIESWSAKFRWASRIREREQQAAQFLLMQKQAKEEAERTGKHIQIIDGAIALWAQKLKDKAIKMDKVEDLEKLINLRLKLQQIPSGGQTHAQVSGGSGTVDLRLRDMNRDEMLKFLDVTMQSIKRVAERAGKALEKEAAERQEVLDAEFKNVPEKKAEPKKDPKPEPAEAKGFADDLDIDNMDLDD